MRRWVLGVTPRLLAAPALARTRGDHFDAQRVSNRAARQRDPPQDYVLGEFDVCCQIDVFHFLFRLSFRQDIYCFAFAFEAVFCVF